MSTIPKYKIAFPAKAGIHGSADRGADRWVPAFAGNAIESGPH
jgi:hypothetical protein